MTSLTEAPQAPHSRLLRPRTGVTIVGLATLVLLYTQFQRIAELVTYDLAGLARDSHLGAAVEFFVFEVPKVLLLVTGVVFLSRTSRSSG